MENVAGGFTSFKQIAKEEKEIFEKALNGVVGVFRTPIAVATQVVSGVNYAFLCNSQSAYPGAAEYNDLVIVYKNLKGDVILKEIRNVKII